MAQAKPKFKRKQHFIKKRFQFNFIFEFCVVVFIGAVISTGLLYYISKDSLTSSYQGSRLVIQSTSSAMLPSIIYTNLITLALIALAVIFITLYISHKIAGPLFRFEKDIEQIGSGDLSKNVFLRNADQIRDMADQLNIMTANLRDKVLDIKISIDSLTDFASKQDCEENIVEGLKKIQKKIDTHFKLQDNP